MIQIATPAVFSIFKLPPDQRVEALRAAIADGADPNAFDHDPGARESLLGRAFRSASDDAPATFELIKELLAHGANPLCSHFGSPHKGENVFDRALYLSGNHAFSLADLHKISQRELAPLLIEPILKACLEFDHRDEKGNNALLAMLLALKANSHRNLAEPIRQALRVGFSPDQPIGDQPNPVIHMVFQYMLTQYQAMPPTDHGWMWDYIELFVEAGADMDQPGKPWKNAWEAIKSQEDTAADMPAFQRLASLGQSRLLDGSTPSVAKTNSRRI